MRRPALPAAGWFRRAPLRRRLALLTALAVAVAVAVSALSCWLLVRKQLYKQREDRLRATFALPPDVLFSPDQAVRQFCVDPRGPRGLRQADATPTVVLADGHACSSAREDADRLRGVTATAADREVAGEPGGGRFRYGTLANGTEVRVYTRNIGPGVALAVATPTGEVDGQLGSLALRLALVAACGVVMASSAGLVVARASLKPVDRLTDVVEHIARTEEVGTTIPVEGRDEIARLSESFNAMSTALAASRDRQTRLVADAGHELRTPLTSLRTNVDLLVRSDSTGRPLPPETRTRLLGSMKAQMGELSTLIGDLLELSRPAAGRSDGEASVVALHEVAARAVDRGRLRGPGLRFEVRLESWYVRGDAHALERAVVNLLDNAVKYSPPGGTVDVALSGGRLAVRDRGPGIAPDELPYVFDRFWRSPSSRQLPGSGLGLSIVAQAVRDGGGEVALGAPPDGGAGTEAVVRLPGSPVPPAPGDPPGPPGRGGDDDGGRGA
ncbi:HAMP domain-containing histidine kinase [Streptacidiphilus sp. ASG 303]|uniref:HAMP domain-containing sensor histidine kinase n=1 Tax=Streptacidiphilus sp. ASG 303 TaxID=2896847 RepID=UPI001E3F12B1|nr:HAMP domain-containing sensor histidine kinase [Streptacidiphilus sp. ASG 303]MCD0485598.1 HAMP domain-containing histidine kinase [Streptacidiphilus sp. ASG 303]